MPENQFERSIEHQAHAGARLRMPATEHRDSATRQRYSSTCYNERRAQETSAVLRSGQTERVVLFRWIAAPPVGGSPWIKLDTN